MFSAYSSIFFVAFVINVFSFLGSYFQKVRLNFICGLYALFAADDIVGIVFGFYLLEALVVGAVVGVLPVFEVDVCVVAVLGMDSVFIKDVLRFGECIDQSLTLWGRFPVGLQFGYIVT